MITRVSTKGVRWFAPLNDFLDANNAVWLGRAQAGQKGHILRNPHKVAQKETDYCKARLHCKIDTCEVCAPCDDGLHLHTTDESLELYEAHLKANPTLILEGLRLAHSGKRAACACVMDARCHIDVLNELISVSLRLTSVQGRDARETIRTNVLEVA